MLKEFVYRYKIYVIILLYLVVFLLIHLAKPKLLYNEEGSFRPFGLGYRHKTVISMWVVSIILAIFCYLAVTLYLQSD